METLSFAFGVLSMVGVVLTTLVVYNIVKAIKSSNQIKSLETSAQEVWRRIDEVERELHTRLDRESEFIHRDFRDQISDAVAACNSYTDKRIDKVIVVDQIKKSN